MIMKYKLNGICSPGGVDVEFRFLPQRHCFTMLFSIQLHVIPFRLGTQKLNTKLNNFYMNIKFDELLREIDIV